MPLLDANMTLLVLEEQGRRRAAESTFNWEVFGTESTDGFLAEESGIYIWDPFTSDCGRFEVDPYKEYGRPFVDWLMKPVGLTYGDSDGT